jgi:hypothetical protein
VFLQGTRLSQFMKSVEQVAGAMGETESDTDLETVAEVVAQMAAEPAASSAVQSPAADEALQPSREASAVLKPEADASPGESPSPPAQSADADPWAAILEAGAAMLQGLATARGGAGGAKGAAPLTIERDPVTGQASIRLPLPEPAVLQRLAKAFEPWLKPPSS